MNISLMGVGIASIVGLLVAWLFLGVFDTQHQDYRAVEAQATCEKARFDVRFGTGQFDQPDPALVARAEKICDEQDKRLAVRDTKEKKADAQREAVKTTIQSIWDNPQHERTKK